MRGTLSFLAFLTASRGFQENYDFSDFSQLKRFESNVSPCQCWYYLRKEKAH